MLANEFGNFSRRASEVFTTTLFERAFAFVVCRMPGIAASLVVEKDVDLFCYNWNHARNPEFLHFFEAQISMYNPCDIVICFFTSDCDLKEPKFWTMSILRTARAE